MAVVSRTATIRMQDGSGNFRQWQVVADVQDIVADDPLSNKWTLTLTETTSGGLSAPSRSTTTEIRVRAGDGSTLIRTFNVDENLTSQTFTLHPAANGTAPASDDSGLGRIGTYIIDLYVSRGSLPTYEVDTDGSPNTPQTGFTLTVSDRGYVRAETLEALLYVSNGADAFDPDNAPASYRDTLRFRFRTPGSVAGFINESVTIGLNGTTPRVTVADNGVDWDGTIAVNDSMPLADATYTCGWALENNALTGVPWTEMAVAVDSIRMDPRITFDHHLQVNDNVFGAAKDQTPKERLVSDLGFVGFTALNARSQAVSGISVHELLRDTGTLVAAAVDRTITTDANGHPPTLATWENSLPGGQWNHTLSIQTADADTLEVNATETYTLLSINPNYNVIAGGGTASQPVDGDHWHAGDDLLVGLSVFDTGSNMTIAADDSEVLDPGGAPYPRAYMIVARFNVGTGRAQYYDSDGVWKDAETNSGNIYKWQLMSILRGNQLTGVGSVGDARTYVKKFLGADTANWGYADMFFIPIVYVSGTPYTVFGTGSALGNNNPHDKWRTDPVAFALHGVLGNR